MRTTIEQFHLRDRVEDDVLGEIYRVTWPGEGQPGHDSESPYLLRLFKRDGIDPERFEEWVGERRQFVGADLGAQVTTSRLLGIADERAFDLFPYVPGRSLAALIEVARRQRQAFPLAVALFVAGRVATGLGVALRHEIDGEPVAHGFLVPQLVRVSEAGGVAIGGLEVTPALRHFRGTAATFARLLPYLPPEQSAVETPHPAGDVYSLGALVYRLLTLRPLTSPSDLHAASSSIPPKLRYLLARSVAERSRRIQSVVDWLRELKALVVEEGWHGSAQDLSAFLAEIDERFRPFKPDTGKITATERGELARIVREARGETSELRAADAPAEQPADNGSRYDTHKIADEDLRPVVAEIRRHLEARRMAGDHGARS